MLSSESIICIICAVAPTIKDQQESIATLKAGTEILLGEAPANRALAKSNTSYSHKSKASKPLEDKLKKHLSLKSSSPAPSVSLRSVNPPSEIMASKKSMRAGSHKERAISKQKAYNPRSLMKSP